MPEQKKSRRRQAETQECTPRHPKIDVNLIGWIRARQSSIEAIPPQLSLVFKIAPQARHSAESPYKYYSTACLVGSGILIAKYLEQSSRQSMDFASCN